MAQILTLNHVKLGEKYFHFEEC
ncbi:protein of unknown function [Magnetospirillum sp. XM-1]|nr:protein of unknown function [Magnetospirillum sp. XM-1]